jgi:hypothetical protein
MQNERVRAIGVGDPVLLSKTGRTILKEIESDTPGWEDWVPAEAHAMVRRGIKRTK